MFNDQQLKIILDDLYAVEPDLKKDQAALVKIIREIVQARPEIKFDENFQVQLRDRLTQKAEQMQAAPGKSGLSFVFGGKFSYALAGAAVLAVVAIGAGFLAQRQGLVSVQLKNSANVSSSQQTFEKIALKENAFGSLAEIANQAAPLGLGGGGASAVNQAVPQSATGASDSSNRITASAPAPEGLGGNSSIAMPYYYYKYVYKGDPLQLPGATVEVLRRQGFDQKASGLGGLLNSFGLGMISLGSFDSLKVQNINLVEDKDLGYSISVDAQGGLIYVSQNWAAWPQPYVKCAGSTDCVDQTRLKPADVLSDAAVIKIAKDFAVAHGVDLGSYGEPLVTDTWRVDYANTADKAQFYIPESANVLFPLKANGQFVYDEGGSQTGINVSVDYRQKKVSNLSNLTSQTYEASNYAAETDAAKILQIVEQGGYWGYGYPMLPAKEGVAPSSQPGGTRVLEIEIGTPKIVYVTMTNYNAGQTNYLLVPSLIFPVIGTPGDTNYYYPKSIVVPLAKDLLEQRAYPPYVLNSSGASAGSATEAAPQQLK